MKKITIAALAAVSLAATLGLSAGSAFAQGNGAMSNDAMSKDSMQKDTMGKDAMSKDDMGKGGAMSHDKASTPMKKDSAMGMDHGASGAMSK
ncbi:pentapeptide MXKDX repeat protein [Paraburkholderia tropica]|uniref:pentapeptide MXKDX repeat protein n=1 Tax=Paraburkholderia tropica TaxID=92647 RepID=UPI00158FCC07|nr:pentapeptide MXKDX repeat protein [Paraburkholderia tropica]